MVEHQLSGRTLDPSPCPPWPATTTASGSSSDAPLRARVHTWRPKSSAQPQEVLAMLKWIVSFLWIPACGFPRPADVLDPRSCAEGVCTDPAYPFCDEGGEITG